MKHRNAPVPDPAETPLHLKKFADEAVGGAEVKPGSQGTTLFIRKTAAEAVAQLPESAKRGDPAPGLHLEDMLGLIAYCYVRGVFRSKEIADRLRKEPELCRRFGEYLPDEDAIKAFRRRYAFEIEEVLEDVYRVFPPRAPKLTEQGASQTEIVHYEAVERVHDAFWQDAHRRHPH